MSALSISCLSTSETMSKEGMGLNLEFRFQISSYSTRNSASWICLRDFDVSLLDSNIDRRRASAVDHLVEFRLSAGGMRGDRQVIKIIRDLSMGSTGEQVEGCFAGQPNPGISLNHCRLRRKVLLLPPFVGQRECAAVHCNIQVCETVPGNHPAIVQSCTYFRTAH